MTTRRAFLQGCIASIAVLPTLVTTRRRLTTPCYSVEDQTRAARVYLVLYGDEGRLIGERQRIWFGPAKGGVAGSVNEVKFTAVWAATLSHLELQDKYGNSIPCLDRGLDMTSKHVFANDVVVFAPGDVVLV